MKFSLVLLYFILAILIFAGLGVIIPLAIDWYRDDANLVLNINKNLITYFLALAATGVCDLILKYASENSNYKKHSILFLILTGVFYVFITMYLLTQPAKLLDVNYTVIALVIISWGIWWFTNYNNPHFEPTSSLGGKTQEITLKNG